MIKKTSKSSKKHKGLVVNRKEGFNVIECAVCKFKHIYPLLSKNKLDEFYSKSFYSKERPTYFREREEDERWWTETYSEVLDLFAKEVTGRSLLDIGSGPGYFLKNAAKKGWNVEGVEPSDKACDYSKSLGFEVKNSFFSPELFQNHKKFDVVNIALVLEHVPSPIDFLEGVKKILKPGGIVCITCPNDYNQFQKILVESKDYSPWWVVPRHHINYFDFKSMKRLLSHTGFDVAELFGTFPMELFLLFGDSYVGNAKIGRLCHRKRKKFELSMYASCPDLYLDFKKSLGARGLGRELVFIARLPILTRSKKAKA
ncbi:MAG: hypothetical protein COV91_00815 [Candidatus Taylorbacteria bacterium CG11_big_fil_rev_8_21_14_0_20_46_11]|uniref:Methyltransferase type 11 n=1 Tax=Candidatus Taylorbacteria bacterium CG11_big_fil_rev_8_21_14_0_20_46_11 TaxID=1975025 RepID=A0A2H0KCS0_9BACT|nr:MAG: hypothetical protein COV91_00815 [Candidatus Taylorbacteria bacterium CG11_big_fil_rev_8_21_14_0_20_46_11]